MGTAPRCVLHVPHASTAIPAEVRRCLALTESDLLAELQRMTDWFTDELFACGSSDIARVLFPVSRLAVDPERFADDAEEPMAKRGMGAVYSRTSSGERLRRPLDTEERELLLSTYYRPHHAALTRCVDQALQEWGQCLIVDCHSFASVPLPHEDDQSIPRPDMCVGTDPYHTPPRLAAAATHHLVRLGLTVARNSPFAGSMVPAKHYQRDPRVTSIMIEVNRALYMDEQTGAKRETFCSVAAAVDSVVLAMLSHFGPP